MIDTQAIRKKILDLAMRGQLTEQLPEDGTARELFQQIQSEKLLLINKGTIKKGKPLPEIEDNEIPFEIPISWLWVRVGSVAEIASGTTPNSSEISDRGTIPYFKVSDMNTHGNETHMIYANNYISASYNGKIFPAGTTIFPKNGGAALTNKRRILTVPSAVDLNTGGCTPIIPAMAGWIRLFMETVDFGRMDTGSNIPTVNATNLKRQIISLPPLAEQQRIVEKIDQAFSVLDTIDTLQAQYADNLTALKAKLIDAAIQGKLTEQLPEDGTADELYEKIQEEKQALIKAGMIKKEKSLPEIREDEIPFEIPKSWKWVRFSDLYSLSNGVASRGTPGGRPHPVLRLADLVNGHINTDSIREIDLSDDEFFGHKVQKGDLVFIRVNGSRDKVATAFLYQGEEDISYCDHLFCGHKISDQFDASFVMMVYHSAMAKAQIDPEIKTTAGQNTINQKSMGKIIIPLPPLAEQERIVARLEELLSVI